MIENDMDYPCDPRRYPPYEKDKKREIPAKEIVKVQPIKIGHKK